MAAEMRIGGATMLLPPCRQSPKKLFNSWALRTITKAKPYFTHIRRVTRKPDSVAIRKRSQRDCGAAAR